MAVRTVTEATLEITSTYYYTSRMSHTTEWTGTSSIKKSAMVFSPFFTEGIRVWYNQNDTYSDSGLGDRVDIEVTSPTSLKISAYGIGAIRRCEQQLCQEIEKRFLEKYFEPI